MQNTIEQFHANKIKAMRKLFLFMNVSLDSYFEVPGHDIF